MARMIEKLRKLLSSTEPKLAQGDDLRLAVAVLLVEAARMDDQFSDAERAAIERLLAGKFELSPEETGELLAIAEATADLSPHLHPFTRIAAERMGRRRRLRLIEMLWEVACSDGRITAEEDHLMRRIAGLIHVSDADRIAARQRVRERSGPAKAP